MMLVFATPPGISACGGKKRWGLDGQLLSSDYPLAK
jgi:hypothetical protein